MLQCASGAPRRPECRIRVGLLRRTFFTRTTAFARANLLRTVVLCAVALILGAVAVRALPEIPDLSGYQSYKTYDPIVMADLRYIAWRGSGVKDCAALSLYRSEERRVGNGFHWVCGGGVCIDGAR